MWAGECSVDELEGLALAAIPLLEARKDPAGLADVWLSLGSGVYNVRCRYEEMMQAAERAREYEVLAGRPHRSDLPLVIGLVYGPRPVDEALRALDALDSTVRTDLNRATLLAMSGRIDEARALADRMEEHMPELGDSAHEFAEIESLAGDRRAAAERLGRFCEKLAEVGEAAPLATYAGLQGRELCAVGRFEEAERCAAQSRELAQPDDPVTQALWRQVSALVSAHRGDHTDAERLAREAVACVQATDSPNVQAGALSDLGDVLAAAGRHESAAAAFEEALALYERKGIVPLARRTRERLATLHQAQA
jgi:tetratricopeptide (TPR) repeat protein